MKILSIKGKNLASIEGEFSIDFTVKPLVNAGLFAITGPTGAGKSTILDALCLALYDKTPRQKAARESNVKISDGDEKEKLSQSDSRLILRRGCWEAFAEVSFVSVNGARYCSNWSVRRARNKTSGNLQASNIALYNTDTAQPVPGTKSELLSEIETLTGMTFDQFTRAVLLAQNEFTAFLKASQQEKADLLEKLTGTDIYSGISAVVFRRTREAENLVREVQLHLDHTRVFTGEELLSIQLQLASAVENTATLKMQTEQLKKVLETGVRIQSRQEQLKKASAALTLQTESLTAAELQIQKAKNELSRIQEEQKTVTPQLNEARQLDTLIYSMQQPIDSASAEVQKAAGNLEKTQQENTNIAGKIPELESAISESRNWLSVNEQRKPLADNAQTILARLQEATKEHTKQQALTIRQQNILEDNKTLTTQKEAGAVLLEELYDQLKPIEDRLKTLHDELQRLKAQDLTFDDEKLTNSIDELLRARDLLSKLSDYTGAVAEESEKLQDFTRQSEDMALLLKKLSGELPIAAARKDTAREMYLQITLEASENVESLRRSLKDQLPCPVCGSTTHPYATEHPQHTDSMEGLKRTMENLATQYNKLESEQHLLQQKNAMLETEKNNTSAVLQESSKELERLKSQWLLQPVYSEVAGLSEPDTDEYIETRLNALKLQNQQAIQIRNRIRSIEKDGNADAALIKTLTLKAEECRNTIEKADRDLLLLQQQATQMREDILACDVVLGAIRKDLNPFFAQTEWFENWKANPAHFLSQLDVFCKEWNHQSTLLTENLSALQTTKERLLHLQQLTVLHTDSLIARKEELSDLQNNREKLREERQKLFGGQEVYVLEESFRVAIQEAGSTLEAADLSLRKNTDTVKETQGIIRQVSDDIVALQMEYAAQMLNIKTWLTEPPAEDLAENALAENALAEKSSALELSANLVSELTLALRQDEANRQKSLGLLQELQMRSLMHEKWMKLNEIIGSSDGRKFKLIAQKYTLEALLVNANQHLADLSPRYSLEMVPDTLALQVVDHYMAGEIRSVHYLSGGESFLVSLALALALASLSGNRMQVESLFIDEGFGSLDPETLNVAMDALEKLHSNGRKVGVISHVQEMTERIPTQIRVTRVSGGKSKVEIIGAS